MAKLVLKYEARVLEEIRLTRPTISIGRTPDNDVVIDNLAVSSHHARIFFDGERFNLEDLNTLNGTFVNNQRVSQTSLRNGDQISIGKHTLVYQDEGGAMPTMKISTEQPRALPEMKQTVMLDTKKQREFLQRATWKAEGPAGPGGATQVGSLSVLSGNVDQKEYILTSKLTLIGKSPMASVKLKGWFVPDVVAAINRHRTGYQIAPSVKGRIKVNGRVISRPQELMMGDVIELAGITLQFNFRE